MTDTHNDDKLVADFRRLRETEIKSAPTFEFLLRPRSDSRPGHRFRRPVGMVLASTALLIVVVNLMNSSRDLRSIDSIVNSGIYPDDFQLALAYEMPTDFLLDTPWFHLASTTPEFQFLTPSYEYPKENSDDQ